MNGILGMNEVLLGSELPPREREFAQMMHDSATSLLRILNDLLDFSKMESGKLTLESLPMSPRDLTGNVTSLFAAHAAEKGIFLTADLSDRTRHARSETQTRIRQILINLVGNAVKFCERGGVTVRLHYTGTLDSGHLIWDVEDTGPGIEPGMLPQLFEPFAQANTSTARRFGGTGLGLSIVRQLTTLMGVPSTRPASRGRARPSRCASQSHDDRGAR